MDAAAVVGDDKGENFCRNLSAAARDDAVEPAAYAEASSGFCGAFPVLSLLQFLNMRLKTEGQEEMGLS